MAATSVRAPREVFDDHLEQARRGSVEDDLQRNYSTDVIVLCALGVWRGHADVEKLARRLEQELPQAQFEYTTTLVEGEVAFLEWTATSPHGRIDDGADSFVIRGGEIVAQTIHYTIIRDGQTGAADDV